MAVMSEQTRKMSEEELIAQQEQVAQMTEEELKEFRNSFNPDKMGFSDAEGEPEAGTEEEGRE